MSHTFHFPTLWTGKSNAAVVTERHDIALLFDATNCNPNGDPDTGNMPRLQPDTLRGLVTDVCLKRKVRNFWGLYPPQPTGYDIFIRESAILGSVTTSSHLALLENRCFEMLEKMRTEGFLTPESHQEVSATVKAKDKKDWPQKSEGCEEFVSKECKGKFDYSPIVAKIISTLAQETEIPQAVHSALNETRLSDDQKGDAEKACKAIEKACADALPQGTKAGKKKLVLKLAKQAFESNAPESALADFSKLNMERANRDALCQTFADVRTFGAVVSTEGPLVGSFYGQIRGPLQITFAESLDKILQLDFSITRCAVASEPKKKQGDDSDSEGESSDNRTMGRKHTVPYGLYRCHVHFSPAFAAKTRFSYTDLDNFLFALTRCFGDYNVDGSSARPGGMRVVGLVDFQHNSALGNAPAHKLFDLVRATGKKRFGTESGTEVFASSSSEFPQGIHDYTGSAPDGPIYVQANKYGQVTGCTTSKPAPKDGNEPVSPIEARRLIWEIQDAK